MFYDAFYSRLFDVHPMCRPMFKNEKQGKFFVSMIALSLSMIENQEKFDDTLVKLTEAHNARGVKAIEYGIVGEVLLWTFRYCLTTAYTGELHVSWLRIICRMLKIMIPTAVKYEMESIRVCNR